jgi:hypothetical protein
MALLTPQSLEVLQETQWRSGLHPKTYVECNMDEGVCQHQSP